MTMLSFHNDPQVKAKYTARVEAHRIADEIVQGVGFETNGVTRGCAVGCTLDVYDHTRYPIELGLPEWLGRLEDTIHEGLPRERSLLWPGQFLDAIPVGVDVASVQWQTTIARMERLLPPLIANKEPYARQCEDAIRGVITMAQGFIRDGFSEAARSAMSAAMSAAESAMSAAMSAAESAMSAAMSAAESAMSAAMSAAESAAWSAAESAAWSAARSAMSAAESAVWSAAESAAWSAAWSAYEQEADTLLTMLRALKP